MQFDLLDFQQMAAEELHAEILKAQRRYDDDNELLGAVVLEAATGAGKTVIATAVIERLLYGADGAEPIPGTTVLWVTNDPSLNAQTARKMQEASGRLSDIRLLGQGAAFNQETFDQGAVYFLNTQAASATARITNRGDKQDWTIWQTIENTVHDRGSSFIVFVDEAHYGVGGRASGQPTVVDKIANGDTPIPVFVGISATADRLNKSLSEQQSRFLRNVTVPISAVKASGLVKDRIVLAPSETIGEVVADTTFVREGVRKTREYEHRWAAYALAQREPQVIPALVIQLPDERSDDGSFRQLLASVVESVLQEWPGLKALQIVHTFGEHAPIDLGGGRAVRWMAPQDIQDAIEVRVVLAKNAITTGWDCPRAEVLVSLRKSTDYTPIAQLIGRIVRQPLARRIVADEVLNNVHAYLPQFDEKTVMNVVAQFSGGEAGASAEVVRASLEYAAPDAMCGNLAILAQLPTYTVPSRNHVPEVRRLHQLATFLENDGIRAHAISQARSYLNSVLDDEVRKLATSGELDELRTSVSEVSIREILVSLDGTVIDGERTVSGTRFDAKNIDDVFKRAARTLKDGTAEAYWSYLVDADEDEDPIEAKITVAALALSDAAPTNLEAAAGSLTNDWLRASQKAIYALPEAMRLRYKRLQAESAAPQLGPGIEIGGTIVDSVAIAVGADLSDVELQERILGDSPNRWPKHLYQGIDGLYWTKPTATDGLERSVLRSELASEQVVGWYRNPPVANARFAFLTSTPAATDGLDFTQTLFSSTTYEDSFALPSLIRTAFSSRTGGTS
ncbi:DEAD/DEAH box helicase [Curtobacterium sp. SAFR-003]|uniref:DEAD/DEAH box helicase n=1 Tax=Curtobacterium sp. SAFR-003 TaxID=3387276 RepID=UPI003F7F6B91